jgi:uncharacterized damage-inducible protein DinB
MNRSPLTKLAVTLVCGVALRGQSNPLSSNAKDDYMRIRSYFIRSAEKMPEASYGFKPVPEVRTFGQIIAHVADDQYNICSMAKGETRHAAYSEIENTLSSKVDLVAALKQAFTYCDGAYELMTDAAAAEIVKSSKNILTKLGVLNFNTWHTWEHYGNIVVYMRMKGLVPPSSERNR